MYIYILCAIWIVDIGTDRNKCLFEMVFGYFIGQKASNHAGWSDRKRKNGDNQ